MGLWNVYGQVYLVYSGHGSVDFGSAASYPYGLKYGCLLQTGGGEGLNKLPDVTYIERTFQNIVSGAPYYVSFWIRLRSLGGGAFLPPSKFTVYLNSDIVYSGHSRCLSTVWQQAYTNNFTTNVTHFKLRFEITKSDQQNRNMGINGIIIHQGLAPTTTHCATPTATPSATPTSTASSGTSTYTYMDG
jgi:hypothetical protein